MYGSDIKLLTDEMDVLPPFLSLSLIKSLSNKKKLAQNTLGRVCYNCLVDCNSQSPVGKFSSPSDEEKIEKIEDLEEEIIELEEEISEKDETIEKLKIQVHSLKAECDLDGEYFAVKFAKKVKAEIREYIQDGTTANTFSNLKKLSWDKIEKGVKRMVLYKVLRKIGTPGSREHARKEETQEKAKLQSHIAFDIICKTVDQRYVSKLGLLSTVAQAHHCHSDLMKKTMSNHTGVGMSCGGFKSLVQTITSMKLTSPLRITRFWRN